MSSRAVVDPSGRVRQGVGIPGSGMCGSTAARLRRKGPAGSSGQRLPGAEPVLLGWTPSVVSAAVLYPVH